MVTQLTYPGVYVEPIISPASGDQEIATSLTAFIGRTSRGKVNEPVLLNSYGDFEREFGGLSHDSTISFSLQQYFDNGGNRAYVVRSFSPDISSNEDVELLQKRGVTLVADANKAFKGKTPTQTDVDTFLAKEVASAMGIEQWYLRQVRTNFNTAFEAAEKAHLAKPAAGAHAPAAPVALSILAVQAPSSVPSFPAFTGILDVNPANASFEVINALSFGTVAQAEMAPTNRQAVIVAAQNTLSPYTSGLQSAVAETLQNGLTSAPATSDQPAVTAAAGGLAAAGTALGTNVVKPVLKQLDALNTKKLTTGEQTELKDFKAALTEFGSASGGAAAVLAAGAKKFAKNVAALTAADVTAAMKTAAAKNAAGLAIAKAATGSEPLDVMANAVKGAINYLKDNWKPLVDLRLQAANPGSWSNDALSVSVNTNGITDAVALSRKVAKADLFNVVVSYVTPDGQVSVEYHNTVTLLKKDTDGQNTPNYLPLILKAGSRFVRTLEGAALPLKVPVSGSSADAAGGIDSDPLKIDDYIGDENAKTGIYALEDVHIFNILCIPPDDSTADTDNLVYATAAAFCVKRNAMLIIDPPTKWTTDYNGGNISDISLTDLGSFGAPEGRSSAVYFPRIVIEDELLNGAKRTFPASGVLAGQWAQADDTVGVWKAPAGLSSELNAVSGLEVTINDAENGVLNPQGINCLRTFPVGGTVVWGARTLRGATALEDEYRYIPVRRLLLFITDWLEVNTRFAVFQPNNEELWAELRLRIGTFLKGLYMEEALVGQTPSEAYFVRCDATTTTPEDQDNGIVRAEVGFSPVKPAEFVVITIQQIQQQAGK